MPGNQIIKLQDLGRFTAEVAKRKHIEIARKGLNQILAKEGGDLRYNIIVDGRASSSEETVRPFGVIKYTFLRFDSIGKYVITTARDLSPVWSGKYKHSWMFIADGKDVFNENAIPKDVKELILVNPQPYARKIMIRGARIAHVPPGIVEKVRQMVMRRFPNTLDTSVRYIELPHAYVLQHNYLRKSGHIHTRAGHTITYPALFMTQRNIRF